MPLIKHGRPVGADYSSALVRAVDEILGTDRNKAHLRRTLRQYETHHNQHRPHRSLDSAAPLKPLPKPVDLERYHVRRHVRISGMINEYRLAA
jgi:hypothetical protein